MNVIGEWRSRSRLTEGFVDDHVRQKQTHENEMAAVREERQDALGVFAVFRRSGRGEDCMGRYSVGQFLCGPGLGLVLWMPGRAQARCQNSATDRRDSPCRFMLSRPV